MNPVLSIFGSCVRHLCELAILPQEKEGDMQYMLLIHDDPDRISSMSEADRGRLYQEYGTFTQELREAGAMVGGDQLQPASTATTVRVRDGEQLVTDGPFAETKEQLGGYYIVEAETLDEALEWAAKVPSARLGTIEVRPIVSVPAEAQA
jgi:hypothetical protein